MLMGALDVMQPIYKVHHIYCQGLLCLGEPQTMVTGQMQLPPEQMLANAATVVS
jgi:hypothetical protein